MKEKNFNKCRVLVLSEKNKYLTVETTMKFDFVCFDAKDSESSPYKLFLQVWSLLKSGKDISCCDYYVNSKTLGDYLLFKAKYAFDRLKPKEFHKLITPWNLMFTRDYFIKNYNTIRDFTLGKFPIFINKDNTEFVSIPLVKTNYFGKTNYQSFDIAFQPKFLDKLYSLYYQKKFFTLYPFYLIFKPFILKKIINTFLDKSKTNKLKAGF